MGGITDYLGKEFEIIIDRPLGSRHPKHSYVYPINYGFIPGTVGADGEPIDAYILGISHPVEQFSGICIAVIHRFDDNDDKLIITENGKNFSDNDIRELTSFQEKHFNSQIIR